ncbi:MAG: protein kinase [Deltaproteobacteria bacterium]|nr:protein kinase [Deltaproteobacteria bacterium]
MDDDKKQLGSAPTTPAPDSTLDMPQAEIVAASSDIVPGAAIGHFRVRRKLGAGGMGVVLEAEDADLGRRVALKLVRTEADTPQYRDRLLREAKAMARLEHPNVVRVYEVGSDRGRLFIAMEFVDGVTLTAWLQERRTWRDVAAMFQQVGAGLAAVHGAGLVHRDFKPDNVLVDQRGRARVADFGLARLDDNSAPQLTKTGVMMGTPGYMAPEQQFGSGVDARADQYSFCVALREALGGRPLDDTRWKAVPEAVRAVVTRGLSYDPDERYASLEALLAALAAAIPPVDDNATDRVRAAPRMKAAGEPRARWPYAIAALAGVGAVAALVAFVTSKRHDPATDTSHAPHLLAPGSGSAEVAIVPADAAPPPLDPRVSPPPDRVAAAPPLDAGAETARTVPRDAGAKHVAVAPDASTPAVAAGSAAIATGSSPPPQLNVDGPTTKHLPAAKPGDPAHLPAVRAAIADLGYEGFNPDAPPASLDDTDPVQAIEIAMVKRRKGDCGLASTMWTAAIDALPKAGSDDQERWKARAYLGRALCALGAGKAQEAMDLSMHAWVHGDQAQVTALQAFARYDVAVAANDFDGKNEAYARLLNTEHFKDATVHHALALWLDGLGLGLHQDAPIH